MFGSVEQSPAVHGSEPFTPQRADSYTAWLAVRILSAAPRHVINAYRSRLTARGVTPSAFERRCIPRITALGATTELHHGLPGDLRVDVAMAITSIDPQSQSPN